MEKQRKKEKKERERRRRRRPNLSQTQNGLTAAASRLFRLRPCSLSVTRVLDSFKKALKHFRASHSSKLEKKPFFFLLLFGASLSQRKLFFLFPSHPPKIVPLP